MSELERIFSERNILAGVASAIVVATAARFSYTALDNPKAGGKLVLLLDHQYKTSAPIATPMSIRESTLAALNGAGGAGATYCDRFLYGEPDPTNNQADNTVAKVYSGLATLQFGRILMQVRPDGSSPYSGGRGRYALIPPGQTLLTMIDVINLELSSTWHWLEFATTNDPGKDRRDALLLACLLAGR